MKKHRDPLAPVAAFVADGMCAGLVGPERKPCKRHARGGRAHDGDFCWQHSYLAGLPRAPWARIIPAELHPTQPKA